VTFNTDVLDPAVGMTLLNEQRQPVVVATTAKDHEQTGRFQEGEQAIFAFSFHNMLAPGRYSPILTVSHRGDGLDVIDRFPDGVSFVVSGATSSGGMIEIPVQTEVTHCGPAPSNEIQPAGGPR
jgi:hypothetical protein